MVLIHSVIIVDNCSIHHNEVALQMIQEVGAIVQFPILSRLQLIMRLSHSKVKAEMRAMEEAQITDIEMIVLAAFSCITVSDCNQWIKDSAIYC